MEQQNKYTYIFTHIFLTTVNLNENFFMIKHTSLLYMLVFKIALLCYFLYCGEILIFKHEYHGKVVLIGFKPSLTSTDFFGVVHMLRKAIYWKEGLRFVMLHIKIFDSENKFYYRGEGGFKMMLRNIWTTNFNLFRK